MFIYVIRRIVSKEINGGFASIKVQNWALFYACL